MRRVLNPARRTYLARAQTSRTLQVLRDCICDVRSHRVFQLVTELCRGGIFRRIWHDGCHLNVARLDGEERAG